MPGSLSAPPGAVLSITRLRLHSVAGLREFFALAGPSVAQAVADPACLAGATYVGPGLAFWTATLWREPESMRRYAHSGAHARALPALARLCSEAAIANCPWSATTPLPSAAALAQHWASQARSYRVERPSPRHARGELDARRPWVRRDFK